MLVIVTAVQSFGGGHEAEMEMLKQFFFLIVFKIIFKHLFIFMLAPIMINSAAQTIVSRDRRMPWSDWGWMIGGG